MMSIHRYEGQIAFGNGRAFQGVNIQAMVAMGIKDVGTNNKEHKVEIFVLKEGEKGAVLTFGNETQNMAFIGQYAFDGDRSVLLRIGGWIETGSEAVRNTLRQLVSSLMTAAKPSGAFDERLAGLVNTRDAKYVLLHRDDKDDWSNAIVTALTTDEGTPLDYATFDVNYTGPGVRISGFRGTTAYGIEYNLGGSEITRKRGDISGLSMLGEANFAKFIDISRLRNSDDGTFVGVATVGNRNSSYSTRSVNLSFDQNGLLSIVKTRGLLPDYGAKLPILTFVGTSNLLVENAGKSAAFIRHRSSELPSTAEVVLCTSTGNRRIELNAQTSLAGSVLDTVVNEILD